MSCHEINDVIFYVSVASTATYTTWRWGDGFSRHLKGRNPTRAHCPYLRTSKGKEMIQKLDCPEMKVFFIRSRLPSPFPEPDKKPSAGLCHLGNVLLVEIVWLRVSLPVLWLWIWPSVGKEGQTKGRTSCVYDISYVEPCKADTMKLEISQRTDSRAKSLRHYPVALRLSTWLLSSSQRDCALTNTVIKVRWSSILSSESPESVNNLTIAPKSSHHNIIWTASFFGKSVWLIKALRFRRLIFTPTSSAPLSGCQKLQTAVQLFPQIK